VTGSLQVKGNVYYCVLSFKDEQSGKWRQKWINTELDTKNNKRNAERFLSDILSLYRNNTTLVSKDILFTDYMYSWLETISGAIEENTHALYQDTIKRYIEPYFFEKQTKLQRLEPQHIQDFYNTQIKNGLSANSVLKQHANIRKSCAGLYSSTRLFIASWYICNAISLMFFKVCFDAGFFVFGLCSDNLSIIR